MDSLVFAISAYGAILTVRRYAVGGHRCGQDPPIEPSFFYLNPWPKGRGRNPHLSHRNQPSFKRTRL